ncbi:hypothetical protein Fot_06399 [Forsythia ovata]|uniref:Uncharacterized protein n=1 Tax=Forsythia ovata TaxID=205694 RepID=A0ABD1WSU5_9LAMI
MQGLVEEGNLNSLGIPQYTPSPLELKAEVEKESIIAIIAIIDVKPRNELFIAMIPSKISLPGNENSVFVQLQSNSKVNVFSPRSKSNLSPSHNTTHSPTKAGSTLLDGNFEKAATISTYHLCRLCQFHMTRVLLLPLRRHSVQHVLLRRVPFKSSEASKATLLPCPSTMSLAIWSSET